VASEQNKQELRDKLAALVGAKFGGDYRAAFGHYDANRDGSISKDELKALLADAGVGSGWTRWAWAAGIIEELDANGDGVIAWPEFAAVFGDHGTPN
jgi:Ca2+-binding EF-hand superfamily protein